MGKAEMSKEEAKLAVEKYKKLLERKKRKKDKVPECGNGDETIEKVLKTDDDLPLSPRISHPSGLDLHPENKHVEETNRQSQMSNVSSKMDYSQQKLKIFRDSERNIILNLPGQRDEVVLMHVER
jgi:hypothetical protein